MEGRAEKTLVVETGILCNNRCVFCYENGYRRIPGYVMLVPPEEIRRRIEWGAANGFNSLSLTGGEPTIRKDFIEIIGWARQAGYEHVAVTTNGSRLADSTFFGKCLRAGLDGMGVSIHSISSDGHDTLTGRPGSFAAAIKAVRNGVRTVDALGGKRFRLNTFTVIHSGNAGDLAQLTDMLGAIGVRLMVLQPPVTGKSNVSPVSEVPLDEVVAAVSAAARAGARNGYLVKPFNVPPCMLTDVTGGLDLTMYSRSSFREHDDEEPGGRSRGEDVGFVRLSACPRCRFRESCSGLSLTLAPVSDLTAAMVAAVGGLSRESGGEPGRSPEMAWITGTELLDVAGIRDVATACAPRFPWICTGGTHRLAGRLPDAVSAAGAGLALVHQARDTRSADRILCAADNSSYLTGTADAIIASGFDGPLAVCGAPEASFVDLLAALCSGGLNGRDVRVRLSMPWRSPEGDEGLIRDVQDFCNRHFGPGTVLEIGTDGVGVEEGSFGSLRETLGDDSGIGFDLAMDVPVTPFENQLWSILNWSVLRNFRRPVTQIPDLPIDSIRVNPFT